MTQTEATAVVAILEVVLTNKEDIIRNFVDRDHACRIIESHGAILARKAELALKGGFTEAEFRKRFNQAA